MIFTIMYIFSIIIQLREEFDRGGQITLSMETGVHDVATLLKEFFRDLPEPLLPKEVQSALLAIHSKLAIIILKINLVICIMNYTQCNSKNGFVISD